MLWAIVAIPIALMLTAWTANKRAEKSCRTAPPGSENVRIAGRSMSWDWERLGYRCVYRDRRGRVVAERHVPFP